MDLKVAMNYWWILLVLFLLITIYHSILDYREKRQETRRPTWEKIQSTLHPLKIETQCLTDQDCNGEQACFRGKCIAKLRGAFPVRCNPHTATWVLVKEGDVHRVTCVCKYPELVTSRYEGGDCDVDVGCGPHGRLESLEVDPLQHGKCICDPGYGGKRCRKLTVHEMSRLAGPCREDEMDLQEAREVLSEDYFSHVGARCPKRPCSFDAWSGRPLKHARLDPSVGCVCDPAYGNFGLRLQGAAESHLKTPGYDACANIFRDGERRVDVELYAAFYAFESSPVAYLQFYHLEKRELVRPLQDFLHDSTLQMSEEWPFDYMQDVLKHQPYTTHTRSCHYETIFNILKCNEHEIVSTRMPHCRDMTRHLENNVSRRVNAYTLLYKFPACNFSKNDVEVAELYRGRYVSNPFHFTFLHFEELFRSNVLMMGVRNGVWHLSLTSSPLMENYRALPSATVPNLHDDLSNSVDEGKRVLPRQTEDNGEDSELDEGMEDILQLRLKGLVTE